MQAAPLADYIATAELALSSSPHAAFPFAFSRAPSPRKEQATLELIIGDDAAEALAASAPSKTRYLLHVRPRNPRHAVRVRERTVTYMNLGDEGPHVPVYSTEQRGPWRPALRATRYRFLVGGMADPVLRLSRRELLAVVGRSDVGEDARWVAIARRCAGPEHGPCYTVTDNEYEVTISHQGRVLAQGVFRVRQPDGC